MGCCYVCRAVDVVLLVPAQVPGIAEANHKEPLLPWGRYHQGKVLLGARVEQACSTPADLTHAAALFKNEKFIMTYRPDTKKVRMEGTRCCCYYREQIILLLLFNCNRMNWKS